MGYLRFHPNREDALTIINAEEHKNKAYKRIQTELAGLECAEEILAAVSSFMAAPVEDATYLQSVFNSCTERQRKQGSTSKRDDLPNRGHGDVGSLENLLDEEESEGASGDDDDVGPDVKAGMKRRKRRGMKKRGIKKLKKDEESTKAT